MTQEIPIRLERDPILESVFEVRFTGQGDTLAELLPGAIFSKVRSEFPKMELLPIAQLPPAIIAADPELRFKPSRKLVGKNFTILIGSHLVALACGKPYPGWLEFFKRISGLLDLLLHTDLIQNAERFSLKYINIIPAEKDESGLSALKTQIRIGEFDLLQHGCQLRTEIRTPPYTNVIQILSNSTIRKSDEEEIYGSILDIDTICESNLGGFIQDPAQRLNAAHDAEKKIFFSLLAPKTLDALKPIWKTS